MKITCNIIEDLLPLYVDRMLSEDSCQLVKEHLESCERCRKILDELRQDSANVMKSSRQRKIEEGAIAAFKGVRRTIWRKRILSVCIAMLCVLTAVRAGYYYYAEKENYISFEDSGLKMKGDQLYAALTIDGRLSSLISPDQKIEFLRVLETKEVNRLFPRKECNELIVDYADQIDSGKRTIRDEDKHSGIEKVYYLPEEYVNYQFDYENEAVGARQTKEVEEHSILLWEKSESGEKNDQDK